MRTKIFVDTWFLVALINKRDQYHTVALQLAQQFDNYPLITTDTILLEFGNALSKNYKKEAVKLIETFLNSDYVEVTRLNPDLFNEALNLYKKHQDKSWGLVDCFSFVVMKKNIEKMTDDDIDTSDIPLLDDDFFANATLRMPKKKYQLP